MKWAWFKEYIHQVSVGVALFLITLTGLIVDVRLAFGKPFPEGHDTWIWALIALAGVNVAGMTAIRATGVSYVTAKAAGKAAGSPGVNVEGDVAHMTTEQRIPTAEMPIPQVEAKPSSAFGGVSNDR